MPEDETLDRRKLRDLRLDQGLTQRELARRCKQHHPEGKAVAHQQISQFEKDGGWIPTASTLYAIAMVLGVRPRDLRKPKVAA